MKTVKTHARTLTAAICALLALATATPGQDTAPSLLKVSTTLHPDGTRTVTKLDVEARTTESSKYSGDKLLQRSVFKLNDQNQPESGEIYDAQGKLQMKVKNARGEAGRVSEETRYTANDQFIVRLVYHYDASGHVKKMEGYDANGNLLPTGPARRDVKKDGRKR